MSRRYPRAHFTKVLHRVFERLDSVATRQAEWTERFLIQERCHAVVTVERVWVFGSYARGAMDCGDLDLIVEVSAAREGGARAGRPPTSTISRIFFGAAPDVRVYPGTPAEPIAGLENVTATQIWGRGGFDWRGALAAIKDDPSATHFERQTDSLPLRMEQINASLEGVEHAIEAHAKGILKWEFLPLPSPIEGQTPSEGVERFLRVASYKGLKTTEVAPRIQAFMHGRHSYFGDDSSWNNNTVRWGGAEILIGLPGLPIHLLDAITTFEIDLVPHTSRRGPNGIWTIARGPAHPIVRQISGKTLYTYTWGDTPQFLGRLRNIGGSEGNTASLFSTPEAAWDCGMEISDDEEPHIYALHGDDLLATIASADVVEINNREYPSTHLGRLLVEAEHVATTDAIIEALVSA
ncbi:nucleotidyltransferase domain-containing protein [Cupriavidus basilensis]|uniref:nucleotidyltransferase domain-containing protein n=1 Tax=Cupriavidus basilensis TaxID=68895 RepID=UPI0023E78632|nr:nucleotidyltransferase domain-containing protein [Cupriavidus basilensis]MDF3881993.1 nucleotidyltransferase domain-containing protein [Cupriavidus basilensis]